MYETRSIVICVHKRASRVKLSAQGVGGNLCIKCNNVTSSRIIVSVFMLHIVILLSDT
jgi:hypothetical protein